MQKIICYTTLLPANTIREVSFIELLLNENWTNGIFVFPDSIYSEIGDINKKLTAKQDYDFMLRAAKKYPFQAIGISVEDFNVRKSTNSKNTSSINYESNDWDEFRTDCYIIGKYQQELLDSSFFDAAVTTLLSTAAKLSDAKEAVDWLEKMISHSFEYYLIDDNTCPILIYRGDDNCYNQLNHFADQLAGALTSCRQRVEIFDVQKEGVQGLTKYIDQHFKAIIGVQTYLFSIMMQDKSTNLHDLIAGPKFNIIFDHPAWLKDHILHGPKDYYLLTHDRNYITFANEYYKNIKGCFYFAPGATCPKKIENVSKIYDITFIGTYYDYRSILNTIRFQEHKMRIITMDFLDEMKRHPNEPAETAFKKVLTHHNLHPDNNCFVELFFSARHACFGIMYYYREKVIQTLLNAGISIHVYGNSWDKSPFSSHPCLIKHPQLTPDESLAVMQKSLISLNIMAWHKGGLTERVLNAMICQSVVLSDSSTALQEYFEDGNDLILFSLEHLDELPALVKQLIGEQEICDDFSNDSCRLQSIAQNGYHRASQQHLWQHRAEYFLSLLENLDC